MPPPDGFPWSPPFNVLRSHDGYATDFQPAPYRITGTKYYVAPGGSGDGSSAASPLGSPKDAIDAINAAGETSAEIICEPGRYDVGWSNRRANCDLAVICPDGEAIMTMDVSPSWTLHLGSVWKTTKASGAAHSDTRVYDHANPDAYGYAQRLTPVGSIADCEATPNSAYYDAGTGTLYVHTFDSREADEDVYAPVGMEGGGHSAGYDLYLDNITFWGGTYAFGITVGASNYAVMKNAKFLYSDHGNNGFDAYGDGFLALIDPATAQTGRDGLNYDGTLRILESGAIGRNNGDDSADSNNATTAHVDARIVRINGDYQGAQNRTLHDVHDSRSWNIACNIAAPKGAGADPFAVGAGHTNVVGEDAKVWLESCDVGGAGYVDSDAALYVRETTIPSMAAGTATPY